MPKPRKHARAGSSRPASAHQGERELVESDVRDLKAQLEEWDAFDPANDMLDWWSEFSAAVRGEIVNAESVREANAAIKERFAGIFVTSRPDGTPRLDFVLKERAEGAPLVSSRLRADEEDAPPELVRFIQEEAGQTSAGGPAPQQVSGSPSCTDQFQPGRLLPPLDLVA